MDTLEYDKYSTVSLQASASSHYSSNGLDLNKRPVERMDLQACVYYHVSGTEKMGGPLINSWQTRQFQATSLSMSIDLTRSPDLKLCPLLTAMLRNCHFLLIQRQIGKIRQRYRL
jgi:hypothetical protein